MVRARLVATAAVFLGITAALALPTVSASADILVFGDSWGTEGASSFQKMASSHGLTVDNQAIGGTTAAGWAKNPNSLLQAWQKNKPKYVWLTIGGNDAIAGMTAHEDENELLATVIANTTTILDPLFAAAPDVKVVQYGYDILTFSKGLLCPILGSSVFWACPGTWTNITCANTKFILLQRMVETLSAKYPRHYAINLLGSIQAGGKVPDASVGHPNLAYYSPDSLMQSSCIHPNDQGFDFVFASMWELFFSKQ